MVCHVSGRHGTRSTGKEGDSTLKSLAVGSLGGRGHCHLGVPSWELRTGQVVTIVRMRESGSQRPWEGKCDASREACGAGGALPSHLPSMSPIPQGHRPILDTNNRSQPITTDHHLGFFFLNMEFPSGLSGHTVGPVHWEEGSGLLSYLSQSPQPP